MDLILHLHPDFGYYIEEPHLTWQIFKISLLLCIYKKISSVNIVDGTQSHVLGNSVVHAIPSLTNTDVLYGPKFPVSLFSISQLTK